MMGSDTSTHQQIVVIADEDLDTEKPSEASTKAATAEQPKAPVEQPPQEKPMMMAPITSES